jgi:hypothetical protein
MSGGLKSIFGAGKVKKQPALPAGTPVEADVPTIKAPIIMPSLSDPAMLQEARIRAGKRSRKGRRGTVLSSGGSAYTNRTLGGTS